MRRLLDLLGSWLIPCYSRPAKVLEPAETPAVVVNNGNSETKKGKPMETTFESLVEFFEAEGLKH